MAAITAAENGLSPVVLLEATSKPLEKVRISGGGRCNVTHACWDPRDLVMNYPRGRLPLLGLFSRFASGDSVAWFSERGLDLVIEADGRMFPASNRSFSVIECLRNSAAMAGVSVKKKTKVKSVTCLKKKEFRVECSDGSYLFAKRVVLATGGHPSGRHMALDLGHTVVAPVPSLFTFALDSAGLKNCSGLAIDNIHLKLVVGDKIFKQNGRMLITHWGVSGPIVLRLSAFAARELHENKYKGSLIVNWIGQDFDSIKNQLVNFRSQEASKYLGSSRPFLELPKRLWLALLRQANIDPKVRWADFSARLEQELINRLVSSNYPVIGRGPFGEEFVTAGGIKLEEINLSTMESKLCKGLYFAGELLDIDGVTGGFNFQHCWTSGWLAGNAMSIHAS